MKKFLLSLLLVLPLCSFAQKGMQGAGLSFGAGLDLMYMEWTYSYRAIYQNFITDRFRISASLDLRNQYLEHHGYYESGDPTDGLRGNTYLAGFEGHYFFNEVRRLRPYVMGGVLIGASKSKRIINYYKNWVDYINHENLQNRAIQQFAGGVKLGVGLNYRISYNLMAQFEVPFYYFTADNLTVDYFPMIPCLNFVYIF